jgi:uncharacterized membrane protein YeiH
MVCVTGADRGLAADAGASIAVVVGVITAVFGRIIRDVLGGESPVILRREIYVIPALIGAVTFVTIRCSGANYPVAAMADFALCFMVRRLALYYGWSLPPYKARPGRAAADVAPEPSESGDGSEPKP